MNERVLGAIFRRNFKSYFLNPTGYVFICVFMLLSSLAAFWPDDFFTSNLATLDQLNKYFPLIMLVFVPAITMSIWADERRQGTDELLLTIPATDFQVVMGKYLAAVAIYSTALLFSAICNYAVLFILGEPDAGLYFSNYLGYWLCGLAMLSIGMVGSFLTGNLTVSFVLGALFNVIPVGLQFADLLLPTDWARAIKQYSMGERLRDFNQGVLSLSSAGYFLLIIATMLYLSMVLIGRRHWLGGRDGRSMGVHYLVRTVSLIAFAVGAIMLAQQFPLRQDLTSDQLLTLTPSTLKGIEEIPADKPIRIEAFISPVVPEGYIEVRRDLIQRLDEISKRSGSKITYRVIDTTPFSEEAERAEKLYGIPAMSIRSMESGQVKVETIYMGVAFMSGVDKIVLPFVAASTPIEYEISRSIFALEGGTKKKLGLFIAHPDLFQELDRNVGTRGDMLIIKDLRLRYDVQLLDTEKPIPDDVAVLLVLQPSLCRKSQIGHLTAAIRRGVPALIAQDPFPQTFEGALELEDSLASGSYVEDPNTQELWSLLGVDINSSRLVSHEYNPLREYENVVPPSYVFIGNGGQGKAAKSSVFNEADPISSKTEDLWFIAAGEITPIKTDGLTFTSLARTTTASGYFDKSEMYYRYPEGDPRIVLQRGDPYARDDRRRRIVKDEREQMSIQKVPTTNTEHVMMARIQGTPASADKKSPLQGPTSGASGTPPQNVIATTATPSVRESTATASSTGAEVPAPLATVSTTVTLPAEAADSKPAKMDVVLVADIDMMSAFIFDWRSQRRAAAGERQSNFDNITIVLNALDVLAGDDRFVEVRKRRPQHRTLTTLEKIRNEASAKMLEQRKAYEDNSKAEIAAEQKRLDQIKDELSQDICKHCEGKLQLGPDAEFVHEHGGHDMQRCQKCEWKGDIRGGYKTCPKCNSTDLVVDHQAEPKVKLIDKMKQLEIFEVDQQRRIQEKERQRVLNANRKFKELLRDRDAEVQSNQRMIKAFAVFVPPIFPLLVGIAVFFSRRAAEHEGVARSRLK